MRKKTFKKAFLLAGLSLCCAVCLAFASAPFAGFADEYNRPEAELQTVSGNVKKYGTLFSFESESELSYVTLGENAESKSAVSAIANPPQHVAEGGKCLEIKRELCPTNRSMKVVFDLGSRDFSATPVVCYDVNSYGGAPGASLYYVRTTFRAGAESYSVLYGYLANSWNVIVVDLTPFGGKSSVTEMEIEFLSDSISVVSWEGRFQIDNIFYGKIIDFRFAEDGNLQDVTAKGGSLTAENDELVLTASGASAEIEVPEMSYTKVLTYLYSSRAENKNSIYTVVDNRSAATEMKIYFRTTDSPDYSESKCKTVALSPRTKKLYAVNFSDLAAWNGNVIGFKYVFSGLSAGDVVAIDDIRLHEDEPIAEYAGQVSSILPSADLKTFSVEGEIAGGYVSAFSGGTVSLFAHMPFASESEILLEEPIATVPLSSLPSSGSGRSFSFRNVSLILKGNKTRIDNKFSVVLQKGGSSVFVDEPRNLDGLIGVSGNPYAFENPALSVSVSDYGAKGDGFTDDTVAIQRAVDSVAAKGGGTVRLDGGKTYIATHIRLKTGVTFEIGKGSVLRQSEDLRDYGYAFELGHNSVALSYIDWAHCNVCSNWPLLYGVDVERVKVTGEGRIVMSDADNYGDDLMTAEQGLDFQYSVCSHRLHVQPVGFFRCKDVEISGITIQKSSGYHIVASHCERVAVVDVEMNRVKCVSSDGINFGGSDGAFCFGVLLNGNDDGIVISAVYDDPRRLWSSRDPGEINSTRNVEVYSSYIQSGGGKAISLIPWGSSDPDPTRQEISGITVKDCTLTGGHSVGTWADNPYRGKYPFDNTETDDYSAMKDFVITDNVYLAALNLYPAKVTNFVTDCGLIGAEDFLNADCTYGALYWTTEGTASAGEEYGNGYLSLQGEGSLTQGIYLRKGEYLFKAYVRTDGEADFGVRAADGTSVAAEEIPCGEWRIEELFCVIGEDGLYRIGVFGKSGTSAVDSVSMTSTLAQGISDGAARSEIDEDCSSMPEGFAFGSTWEIRNEEGNGVLCQTAVGVLTSASTYYAQYADFRASLRVRFDCFSGIDNMVTLGLRASASKSYIVYFSRARNQIAIRKDVGGEQYLATAGFSCETGIWYDVSVSCASRGKGVAITLWVNGEKVLSAVDETSVISMGAFRFSCYNTRASFDDVFVSEITGQGEEYRVSLIGSDGKAVENARAQVFADGVPVGEYSSVGGEVKFFAGADASVALRVSAFGYRPTGTVVLGDSRTIVMEKTEDYLADEFETVDWLTGASAGYSASDGKLVQSDGSRSGQSARSAATLTGDFVAETTIRYTGGNAGAGDNVSLYLYKGEDFVRIQYQPVYGLVSVHRLNTQDGLDCYALSGNLDGLKQTGAEILIRVGTKGNRLTVSVFYGGNAILTVDEEISFRSGETTFAFSAYGITFESEYFYLSAGEKSAVRVLGQGGVPAAGVTVTTENGESAVTDANGVVRLSYAEGNRAVTVKKGSEVLAQKTVSGLYSVVSAEGYSTGIIEKTTYTITFLSSDGEFIGMRTAVSDEAIAGVPVPVVGGNLVQTGWTDESGKTVDVFALRENATVRAAVGPVRHTVVFVARDGKKYVLYVAHGEEILPPSMDAVAGYVQTGYDSALGAATRDRAIYATYEPVLYTVTFRTPDGEEIARCEVPYGGNALPPIVPAPEGYVFVGFDGSLVGITENTVFVARFEKQKHRVVFLDYYGNTLKEEEVKDGEGATAPALSSDALHVFKGWDVAFDCVTGYTLVKPLVNDADEIDVTVVDTITGKTSVVTIGKTAPNEIDPPAHEGYVFGGWYFDAAFLEKCDLSTAAFESNVYLYAKYNKIVSPSVVCEGGSVVGLPETVEIGRSYSFTVAADKGKTVVRVEINGMEIAAENGAYVFTAEGDSVEIVVSCQKKKGCGASAESGLAILFTALCAFALCRIKSTHGGKKE